MTKHRAQRAAKAKRRTSRALGGSARPSLIEFISDPELLGPFFEGPSWDLWKVVVKAATAEPLTPRERKLFASVAGGRKPPTKPVRELVCVVGRGGGKDAIASAIACHAAVTSNFSRLRPGERGVAMVLATDRDQAGIAHGFVRGYFERVPLLTAMVESETADELHLANAASVVVSTANTRAPRGRTICAAVYDELGFWQSEESVFPDVDVDAAVSPGLLRFPGSIKILISSANKRGGLLYERYAEHFGKDSDVLVVLGTSLEFNPTLDRAAIERDLERDPERYRAEYLSEWRSDLTGFLDGELIDAAVERGVIARPPAPSTEHIAFVDASGGRGTAFTAAIAHAEGDDVVLDAIFERRAPFAADAVVDEVAALLRTYRIARCTGDNYAGSWVADAFERRGIRYAASERKRAELYIDVLPLLTAGRARLLDHPRLRHQLVALERRTTPSGRDEVRHPRGGADDVANSAAGALVVASLEARPSLIPTAAIKVEAPDAPLGFVDVVFAALWIAPDGESAHAMFAHVLDEKPGGSIILTGFDERPWSNAVPEAIATELGALSDAACAQNQGTRNRGVDVLAFAPAQFQDACWGAMLGVLAPRLADDRSGLRMATCEPIEAAYVRDPIDLVLRAGAAVSASRVRMTSTAQKLTGRVPLMAALAVTAGAKLFEDPLRAALLLGIVLGVGEPPSNAAPAIPAARLTFA